MQYEHVYYYGQNSGVGKKWWTKDHAKREKEEEGYMWVKGDHIAYRYEFLDVLGEGSFGQVFKCLDHKYNKTPTALKIVKNNDKYSTQAKI